MVQRERVAPGVACWIDLWTSDVRASRNFYSELFGWTAATPSDEFGGYWMFFRDGNPVAGGVGDMGDLTANDAWKIYLSVPDVADAVVRAEARGAQVVSAPVAVGDMGVQAVLDDATGATLGLWQPLSFPGFTTSDEHGTPCWFELNARDFDAALAFYTEVFGLGARAMANSSGVRYGTLSTNGLDVAGVLDAANRLGDAPLSWVVYWHVDDIDAAVVRVAELGGVVLDGPAASPFGRLTTVRDPTGALFKLRGW